MSERFTPGPWRFSKFSAPGCWLEGVGGRTVYHVDDYGNEMPSEADAALIAAAPDLYEALCACHAMMDFLEEREPLMRELREWRDANETGAGGPRKSARRGETIVSSFDTPLFKLSPFAVIEAIALLVWIV